MFSFPSTFFTNSASSPFDPDSIANFNTWWDTSQNSSLSPSSGDINAINDLKGSTNTTQTIPAAKPFLVSSAFNSKDALLYNGSSDYMTFNPTSLPIGSSARSMFFVTRHDNSSVSVPFTIGNNTSGERFSLETSRTQLSASFGSSKYGTSGLTSNSGIKVDSFFLPSGGSASNVGMYRNGVNVSPSSQAGSNPAINTTSTNGFIGRYLTAAAFHNGYIAEILIYARNLTTAERLQIHDYLIAKWGIIV
jgi:hypothetical protein